ncbi:fluoride efflux transporter FluC [Pseudactinotalea sp. Z1748]|uniref:fluoride efflux transporter FluC n=1 Tax=Pseudactinotalea sp. Z1748 TaxID=3413027 RepID=UPI003C7AD4AB
MSTTRSTAPRGSAEPVLRDALLVASGGSLGTLARYVIDALLGSPAGFPVAILAVNLTGAFLLGVLVQRLAASSHPGRTRRRLHLLLGAGLLGGYTTYSLLATDIAQFLVAQRYAEAIGYGGATLLLGLGASWAGLRVADPRTGRR